MRIWLVLLVSCFCFSALAAEEAYQFASVEQEKLFLDLTQELRCPQCQNQNIADSDAMIAHDLRRKVYELIQQGRSREEIVNFMKARYGDFVSYQPPVTPITVWLWVLPLVFILIGAIFVYRQRQTQTGEFDPATLAKADSLLEKDK